MPSFGGKISRKRSRRSYKATRRRPQYKRKNSMRKYVWSKYSPDTRQRTVMLKRCGKKCFLGTHKSFPICRKNTCKRDKAGVHAAYVRAREYTSISKRRGSRKKTAKYSRIANKAKRMLH